MGCSNSNTSKFNELAPLYTVALDDHQIDPSTATSNWYINNMNTYGNQYYISRIALLFSIIQTIIYTLFWAFKSTPVTVELVQYILYIITIIPAMYLLVAITGGSAFSSVLICNSNFFGMRFFDMGLTRRQQRVFRNKR